MKTNASTLKIAFRIAIVPVLTVIVAACSPVNFSTVNQNDGTGVVTGTSPAPTSSPGTTCTVQNVYRETKIMFLVDMSGSNSQGTYNIINGQNQYFPASDPYPKAFRYGAINQFFTNYQNKTNFNWGFVGFAGTSATSYIGSGAQFTSNTSAMSQALQSFKAANDDGQTPYAVAIQAAARAIANDPDLNSSAQPNYYVILLSDGFPTDYTDAYGNFKSSDMKSDVSTLLAQAPGRVKLSTVYYASGNQTIPVAISDLQQIATAGGGQFANVNTSSNTFTIDDVIGTTCN